MRTCFRQTVLLGGALALFLAGTPLAGQGEDPKPITPADRFREQAARQRELIQRILEQQRRIAGGGLDLFDMPGFGGLTAPGIQRKNRESRLGVELSLPSAALVDQLDLPKNQGMVLDEVGANSPASKAGLKKNDILLEVNGKTVPNKMADFQKLLAGIKADSSVDVVVMRKGRKETIKGVTFPEAKQEPGLPGFGELGFGDFPMLPGNLEKMLNRGEFQGGTTTISRNNDQFTAKNNDGKVTIAVSGTVEQGNARISSVSIDEGAGKKTYDSLDKVPATFRKRVEELAAIAAGGTKPQAKDDL